MELAEVGVEVTSETDAGEEMRWMENEAHRKEQ